MRRAYRFHAEAETAAHLDHPNIVSIYEVGVCDGQPFYSMQLIEGHNLADETRHVADGSMNRKAAETLSRIARAVSGCS